MPTTTPTTTPSEIINRPCTCGSNKESWWEYDARGIPLARVCEDCKTQRLSKFRPDVLTNPNYPTLEKVEPE